MFIKKVNKTYKKEPIAIAICKDSVLHKKSRRIVLNVRKHLVF